jgi:hypothetical protein
VNVLRRLYNVAYGRVRLWQKDDGSEAASEDALERLRESVGRSAAAAELGRAAEAAPRDADRTPADPEAVPVPTTPRERRL